MGSHVFMDVGVRWRWVKIGGIGYKEFGPLEYSSSRERIGSSCVSIVYKGFHIFTYGRRSGLPFLDRVGG